jgi:1A family penicillin-binding protein
MQAARLITNLLIKIGRPPIIIIRFCFWIIGYALKNFKPKLRFNFDFFRLSFKYIILGIIFLLASGGGWWFYQNILVGMPNINLIYNPPNMSTKILDREGNLLYTFYSEENRSWVPIDKIPQSLIWATLSIEDKEFYKHHGLSLRGIAKATIYNFKNGEERLRGGSTITQQLVKNVYLSNEKSWERKIKEALMAMALERKFSKEEILERYFNQVAFGGEIYGVAEAAIRYFGKNVWEINMAEASFLAGLPAAPSIYSPFGSNIELAYFRQNRVIEEMVVAGYISEQKGEEIRGTELVLMDEKRKIEAPHFVFYVKEYLENKLGFRDVEKLGLMVRTSLSLETQKMAQEIVEKEVGAVRNLRINNGAALVLNPKNGEILAMVGSKDYFATDIDGKYNVTTALRQPGSAIKPINYLLALENGMSLNDMIEDSRVTYQIRGQKPYSPQNYNGRYMGRVSLKTALASSLNTPSVKLLEKNGVDNMINLAKRMGINSWNQENRFGLSLALGSGEVKMTEISQAYGVLANLGEKVELKPILEIRNYLGEKIYEGEAEKERVVEEENPFLVNMALADNNARAPIFGLNSKLKIGERVIAVKTGTTNSLRDNWCIGWTPEILVATWVGNNDNSPMSWVASGVSGATPIWNKIMTKVTDNMENIGWKMPGGIQKTVVCGKEEYLRVGEQINSNCGPKFGAIGLE